MVKCRFMHSAYMMMCSIASGMLISPMARSYKRDAGSVAELFFC